MPPYTTRSSGRSATSGSRLFISMRSGASVSQLLQESCVPRGARTTRGAEVVMGGPCSCEQQAVGIELLAMLRAEARNEIVDSHASAFLARHVEHYPALMQHDRARAHGERVAHAVRHHQGRQAMLGNDALREVEHEARRARIERRDVLVEQ